MRVKTWLVNYDTYLTEWLTVPPESKWWQAIRLIAHTGDGAYVFGGLGFVYIAGWLWGEPLLRERTIIIALFVFMVMVIVTIIKFIARRKRPHPPGEFVSFQYDKYSFPSGHAARLVALAVSTIFFYPFIGLLLGLVAICVATARVVAGIHYVSDVIAGLITGAVSVWVLRIILPTLIF